MNKGIFWFSDYWKLWLYSLVSKIVPKGKTSIDCCLRKCRGNLELREGMVVKENGVQAFAQCVVCIQFDGPKLLACSNLIVFNIQISNDGNIIPQGQIGPNVQITFQTGLFTTNIGHKLYIFNSIPQA